MAKNRTKKHSCKDHWHWECLGDMRIYREENNKKIYKVRCGICGREDEVDSSGKPIREEKP